MSISHGKTPNSQRPKGARNAWLHADLERKRAEGKARQEAYDKLSLQERIDRLDRAFGKGQGAVKERAKLEAKIAKAKAPTPAPKVEEVAKSDKKSKTAK